MLREVAGVPDEIASGFAGMALEIIGEEVPYKLSQQVPLWTIQVWALHLGIYWIGQVLLPRSPNFKIQGGGSWPPTRTCL